MGLQEGIANPSCVTRRLGADSGKASWYASQDPLRLHQVLPGPWAQAPYPGLLRRRSARAFGRKRSEAASLSARRWPWDGHRCSGSFPPVMPSEEGPSVPS
jgi:hypothetical protein